MTDLGTRLQQARQGEVLRVPRIVSDAPVPFQITELGTRSAPEGLIAHPLTASRLNLEAIQWSYRVRGMGYPWDVVVEELTLRDVQLKIQSKTSESNCKGSVLWRFSQRQTV